MASMDGKDELLARLAAFGKCVESSTVYMVLATDSRIDALQEVDQIARALALTCENIFNEIAINPVLAGCLLDPCGQVIDGLSAGEQRIGDLLPHLMAQSSAVAQLDARDQARLDLLNFAFERCMESFGWVIDAVKKLRQAILTHDRAPEPRTEDSAVTDAALADSFRSNVA